VVTREPPGESSHKFYPTDLM